MRGPFRAKSIFLSHSQGVALGWYAVPRWGGRFEEQQVNAYYKVEVAVR